MAAELRDESGDGRDPRSDRCPYSRSFSPGFADDPSCAAYQGATFTVTDTANRALGSAVTCRHLAIGTDQRHRGRFYPRCGLGDAGARLRWAATVTPGRLAVMRALETEFDELTRGDRHALFDAKARLLASGETDVVALEALELQLSSFLDRVDAFIAERSGRLADVGLGARQLALVLMDWSLAWLRSHRLFTPAIADVGTGSIAPAEAAFLGVDLAAARPADEAREVVARAGELSIESTVEPAGLLLRGEIDVSNSDAIATALASAMATGADVTVDFRDVLFCDLSGLRVLVRAAASSAPGQRIVVTRLPEHLRRALGIVGWADLPGLIVSVPRLDEPLSAANQ